MEFERVGLLEVMMPYWLLGVLYENHDRVVMPATFAYKKLLKEKYFVFESL